MVIKLQTMSFDSTKDSISAQSTSIVVKYLTFLLNDDRTMYPVCSTNEHYLFRLP